MAGEPSFPRLSARTRRFTLGAPRDLRVADDGARVAFLRSAGPTDPLTRLWAFDPRTGTETMVADPAALGTDAGDTPAEELARRQRARETATGIVGYATDRSVQTAAFTLAGRLFLADLVRSTVRELPTAGPAVAVQPDPTGTRVGYVTGGQLHVVDVVGADRTLTEPGSPEVSWGLPEFVAAEEMGRHRGYWWAPDGESLLVARVDVSRVDRWHLADPARPDRTPGQLRYPAAGTANARVSLFLVGLDGTTRQVGWDADGYPYLAAVHWSAEGPPLVGVQSRDQRRLVVLEVDPAGQARLRASLADPCWVDLVPGVPDRLDGRLVLAGVVHGRRRVLLDGQPVGPADVHAAAVLHCGPGGVVFAGWRRPTVPRVWRCSTAGEAELLTARGWAVDRADPAGRGSWTAVCGGPVVVATHLPADDPRPRFLVLVDGQPAGEIGCHTADPPLRPRVHLAVTPGRRVRYGLLLPRGHRSGSRLPVLLDPYGGPAAQRVVAAGRAWLEPQWLADQGFAVVVADGRGTPGRDAAWERAVAGDLAGPALEDQLAALRAAASEHPDLDLHRVGIRGWSHGGYLAALAVLARPDVFHAAVAGAPVTDWRLYDTHYTERYLGHPDVSPDAYLGSSLLPLAPRLRRPLLLVHGLLDDNVLAAHTLRLSARLLVAGRPHSVLPLTTATHFSTDEDVRDSLLRLEVDFLRRALAHPEPLDHPAG